MDSIDGNYYFTCYTNGCPVGGPHKISKNAKLLDICQRNNHAISFHNIRENYRPKLENEGLELTSEDFRKPKPKLKFHEVKDDKH